MKNATKIIPSWLVKFAPFRTPWTEIVRRGIFTLRGVRNAEARKHLSAMRLGDTVFFYQSQRDQAILGILRVTREAYPDPTSVDPRWLTCDFTPVKTLDRPIPLSQIRAEPSLANLPLLRRPRLAVMPVTEAQAKTLHSIHVDAAQTPKGIKNTDSQ